METDSSVVGLAHFSKAMTTDALNLVMASKAFTAVPRAVIGMARDEDAEETTQSSCLRSSPTSDRSKCRL